MIELTDHQRRELIDTDVPHVLDPVTWETYVLVKTDVYERLRMLGLLGGDTSPATSFDGFNDSALSVRQPAREGASSRRPGVP
jgi:hypothetical protein